MTKCPKCNSVWIYSQKIIEPIGGYMVCCRDCGWQHGGIFESEFISLGIDKEICYVQPGEKVVFGL